MNRMISAATLAFALAAAPALAAPETTAVMDMPPPMFVAMVASSNAFEIRSSQLAEERAQSPEVKDFAAQMIADHTRAGEALATAAGEVPVPADLAPRHREMLAVLEQAQGPDFERIYIEMQAGAHAEAVSLFSAYAQHGTDPELQAFAAETLPTLEAHRSEVSALVSNP